MHAELNKDEARRLITEARDALLSHTQLKPNERIAQLVKVNNMYDFINQPICVDSVTLSVDDFLTLTRLPAPAAGDNEAC